MSEDLLLATDAGVVTVRRQSDKWEIASSALAGWSVTDVAESPSGRLYAGTRGDGVWASDDGGDTWQRPNRGRIGPGKVHCVTVDPHNPDRVYAGAEPIGIWLSEDAGHSWTEITSLWDLPSIPTIDYPVYAVEPHVRDITIDPVDPLTIYAALQVGAMAKSTDGGASWTILDQDVDADIHTIVVRPDAHEHLYVATGGHDSRLGTAAGRALYESKDGGVSWSPLAMEFQQEYGIPIALHQDRPNVLFSVVAKGTPSHWRGNDVGSQSLLIRSDDSGDSWQVLETGFPEIDYDFPGSIAISPADPDHVFVATRKGQVLESKDRGDSWSDLGIKTPPVMAMTVTRSND